MDCGRTYGLMGWWRASDELWRAVTGRMDGSGLLCPDCFGMAAYLRGIELRWTVEREEASRA